MREVKKKFGTIKRIFLLAYLLVVHTLAIFFLYEKFVNPYLAASQQEVAQVGDPTDPSPVPEILPIPEITADPLTNNAPVASANGLVIPVVGIKREQLQDTFNDSRSAGRVHNAIDIMAPLGTPVIAVADGEIAKFFDSERGGITIYQYSADRRYIYYYAHLQKRADNLKEKDFVKQGSVIGYVGDTGNSGAGNYHLHFTITQVTDGQRFWEGTDVNPYPFLKEAAESR